MCDEDDLGCRGGASVAGVVLAGAIMVALFVLCAPCAAIGAAAAAAITASVVAAVGAAIYAWVGDDRIGSLSFAGSPADFGERAAVSHQPSSRPQPDGQVPGPLRRATLASDRGTFRSLLALPDRFELPPARFAEVRWDPAQTASADGKLVGFRERRRIAEGGGDYELFMLWQRITCGSEAECQGTENTNPARP